MLEGHMLHPEWYSVTEEQLQEATSHPWEQRLFHLQFVANRLAQSHLNLQSSQQMHRHHAQAVHGPQPQKDYRVLTSVELPMLLPALIQSPPAHPSQLCCLRWDQALLGMSLLHFQVDLQPCITSAPMLNHCFKNHEHN
jgi:hypothetical protein